MMGSDKLSFETFMDKLSTDIKDVYDNDKLNKIFDSLRIQELSLLIQQKLKYNVSTAGKLAEGVINEGKNIVTNAGYDHLQAEIEEIKNNKPHLYSILGFGAPTTLNVNEKINPLTFKNEQDIRRCNYQSFMDILNQKCPADMEKPYGERYEITSFDQIETKFEDFLLNPAQGLTGTVLAFFDGHGGPNGFYFEKNGSTVNRDYMSTKLYEVWDMVKAKGHLREARLQIVYAECCSYSFKIDSFSDSNVTIHALATRSRPETTNFYSILCGNITSCKHLELDEMADEIGDEVAGNIDVTSGPTTMDVDS